MKNSACFIPEEMGSVLRRSAYSPNIKERMDASCAVFDSLGRMIAQAEHIPVHLGSMPLAVEYARKQFQGDLRPGDQIVMNDPYRGGSHLPDITLIKPVFLEDDVLGYAVNKAHHSDVGGKAPGSMPSGSRTLHEEGLVLAPTKLLKGDVENRVVFETIEKETRTPKERLGDLRAQIAANNTGAYGLLSFIEKYGLERFKTFVEAVLDYSEVRVRKSIERIPKGTFRAEDFMDDDGIEDKPVKIAVAVTIQDKDISVDFTGTDSQVVGNINSPYAVALSSVYYVMRVVTDPNVPPNHGCLRPVSVNIPKGTLLNPNPPAAVSAGNVETSQRIVDVLFSALAEAIPDSIPAQSQGTMNNLIIGSSDFSYYETIAGGEGALSFRNGQSGIHSHMTNTANTPIEALESAYPLRVECYELIEGTGGSGGFDGGMGVRRKVRFLGDEGTLSIISDRRKHPPRGLSGGGDGRVGRNYLIRDGKTETLPSKVTIPINKDDVVVVETPGGGGYGGITK
jgi:N-methylhydantoinase B